MPIFTDRNTAYGSLEVNNKYSPLANITLVAGDQAVYTGILSFRDRIMRARNLFPRTLTLVTPGWPAVVAAEAGHAPPLVVVSTARGGWIAKGIVAAATQRAALNIPAFTNENDTRALRASSGQEVSPPIYTPLRIPNQNRNVYVVVHSAEYDAYRAALDNLGVTVVGWRFAQAGGVPNRLVGFGPSRFAAIEFCKLLRRLAAAQAPGGQAPWDVAWLLDDNVVWINNFAGFGAVDAVLAAAHPVRVCAGFKGGSLAKTFDENVAWARQHAINPGQLNSTNPGLLQQAVLWNIAYLDTHHMNIGLPYITSAEDVSIGKYFDNRNIGYFYYNGMTITKEIADPDDSPVAAAVGTARRQLTAWVAAQEAAAAPPPGQPPPPPINVQPARAGDGGLQLLSAYVVNHVLPNAPAVAAQAGNASTQNTAKSQAVEQITAKAIGSGWIAPVTEAAVFQVNGAAQQVVQRKSIP